MSPLPAPHAVQQQQRWTTTGAASIPPQRLHSRAWHPHSRTQETLERFEVRAKVQHTEGIGSMCHAVGCNMGTGSSVLCVLSSWRHVMFVRCASCCRCAGGPGHARAAAPSTAAGCRGNVCPGQQLAGTRGGGACARQASCRASALATITTVQICADDLTCQCCNHTFAGIGHGSEPAKGSR